MPKKYGPFDPIPKTIEHLILDRVNLSNRAPYFYSIRGVYNARFSRYESAHKTYTRIKEWAESIDSDVTLIEDQWLTARSNQPTKGLRLIVEITDPAAHKIDKLLESHAKTGIES